MKTYSIKSLKTLASKIEANRHLPWTPTWDVYTDALETLNTALDHGLVLNSGDGFYYARRRKGGGLYAHDGSKIPGRDLLTQLLNCVWTVDRIAEVIEVIDNLGFGGDEAAIARQVGIELSCSGYAREPRG